MMHINFIFLTLFLMGLSESNLFCHGDFENWKPYINYPDCYYSHELSNQSCWYEKSMRVLQAKIFKNISLTIGADLSPLSPSTFCQTIILEIGKLYHLSYDIFCTFGLYDMTWNTTLNSYTIDTPYIANEGLLTSRSLIFEATQSSNQICFKEAHRTYPYGALFVGGFLDNVTLQQIPQQTSQPQNITNQTQNITNQTQNITQIIPQNITNYTLPQIANITQPPTPINPSIPVPPIQHIIIQLKIQSQEKIGKLRFKSNFSAQAYLFFFRQQDLLIEIQGQKQEQAALLLSPQGLMQIQFEPKRSYNLQNVTIKLEDLDTIQKIFTFEIILSGQKVRFYKLNEDQKMLIAELEPVFQLVIQMAKNIYLIFSQSLATYFVFNLFAFCNLSLMYQFLLMRATPTFLRKTYEIIGQIIYVETSFLVWLSNTFQFPLQAFQLSYEEQITQFMPQFEQGYLWLGSYDMSSKLFENNIDNFSNVALIILKLGLCKLILLLFSKRFIKIFKLQINSPNIVLFELLSLAPIFILSACISLMSSYFSYLQKIEKSIQISIFFVCMLGLPLWVVLKYDQLKQTLIQKTKQQAIDKQYVLKYYQTKFKKNKQKKNQLKLTSLKKKVEQLQEKYFLNTKKAIDFDIKYSTAEMLLSISVPIFIMLKNLQAFFIVNGFIIFLRIIFLCRGWKFLSLKEKIMHLLMTLVWICHHFGFSYFYILELIQTQNGLIDNQILDSISKNIALMLMITIPLGATLQIIYLFLNILIFSFSFIKKIIQNYCCPQKSIHPLPAKKSPKITVITNNKSGSSKEVTNFKRKKNNFMSTILDN